MSEEQRDDKKGDAHKALVHEVCDRIKFFERDAHCFRCAAQVDTPHGKGTPGCYLVAEETITLVMRSAVARSDEWRAAALRLGEQLTTTGPNGYYSMTPTQWLDWCENSLPSAKARTFEDGIAAAAKYCEETLAGNHPSIANYFRHAASNIRALGNAMRATDRTMPEGK